MRHQYGAGRNKTRLTKAYALLAQLLEGRICRVSTMGLHMFSTGITCFVNYMVEKTDKSAASPKYRYKNYTVASLAQQNEA